MIKVKKLTPTMLRKLVFEEKARLSEDLGAGVSAEKAAKDTDEVEADELAGSIEQEIDWMKALKIKEDKLRRQLKRISEAKRKVRSRVVQKFS